MRISDWSSDVCSSDLVGVLAGGLALLSLAGGRRGLGLLQRVGRRDVERLGRHRRRGTARIAILAGLGTVRSLPGADAGLAACLPLDALLLAREPACRIDGVAAGATTSVVRGKSMTELIDIWGA